MGNVQSRSTQEFLMNISPSPMGPVVGKTGRSNMVTMTDFISEENTAEPWTHADRGLMSRGPTENDEQTRPHWQSQTQSHQNGHIQSTYQTDRQVSLPPQLNKILEGNNNRIQTDHRHLLEFPVDGLSLDSRDSRDSRAHVESPHQTYGINANNSKTSQSDSRPNRPNCPSRAAVESSSHVYAVHANNVRTSNKKSSHVRPTLKSDAVDSNAGHKCTDIQTGLEFEESERDVSTVASAMVPHDRSVITSKEMGLHSRNVIPRGADVLAYQPRGPECCVRDARDSAHFGVVQGKNSSIEYDGIPTLVGTRSRSLQTYEPPETMAPAQMQGPQVPNTRETVPGILDTGGTTVTSPSAPACSGADTIHSSSRPTPPAHCQIQGNEVSTCFDSRVFPVTTQTELLSMTGSILLSQNFISDRTESFAIGGSREFDSDTPSDFEPIDKCGAARSPGGLFDSFDTSQQMHQISIESQTQPDVEPAVSAYNLNFGIEQSNSLSSDSKIEERWQSGDQQSRALSTCNCCHRVEQNQVRLCGPPGTDSLRQLASYTGETNSFTATGTSAEGLDSWRTENNFQPNPGVFVQESPGFRLFGSLTDSGTDPPTSLRHHAYNENASASEQNVECVNSPERDVSTSTDSGSAGTPYGGLAKISCRQIFNSQQKAYGNICGYDTGDFNEPDSVQEAKQKLKEMNRGLSDQDDIFYILTPRKPGVSNSGEPNIDIDMDPILPGTVCHQPVEKNSVHPGKLTQKQENVISGCLDKSEYTSPEPSHRHRHQPAHALQQIDSSKGSKASAERGVRTMRDSPQQEKKEPSENGHGGGKSKIDRQENGRDSCNMSVSSWCPPAFNKNNFVAYLCCAPEDLSDFGLSFHTMLENWGFRIFIAPRDLQLTGAKYNNMAHWLEERCNGKIIVVLSKNYSASDECLFLTYFAKTLDPDARKRNIIPVQIDREVEFLNVLKGVSVIKYNHDARNGWLKKKLVDAIAA